MAGDPGQYAGEPGSRIHAVQLRGGDEGIHH
ncbi:MAG: hypothetical protein JWP20_668, partial [Roseomonas sp.]|nr:hypothetical protein [Roseomonas sp.]